MNQQNFTPLMGQEPLRKYSRRLDERLRVLGLEKRVVNWDAESPEDKMESAGVYAYIMGEIDGKYVGALVRIDHESYFLNKVWQEEVYSHVVFDAKAKGLIHNDKA